MKAASELDVLRATCLELGGGWVDLWAAPQEAQALLAHRRERGLRGATAREVARDVVSAVLVREVQAGRDEALEPLLALWRADVLHWCRWQAGRGLDPDDLAQDVVVRVTEQLRRLREPGQLRSWLWGLTMNVAREHARRPWHKRWTFGWAGMGRRPDPAPDPEEHAALTDRAAKVREVLFELDEQARELLWLHYVEGLGRAEIAERTGLPRGTLNRRMTQARRDFEAAARRIGLEPEGER